MFELLLGNGKLVDLWFVISLKEYLACDHLAKAKRRIVKIHNDSKLADR